MNKIDLNTACQAETARVRRGDEAQQSGQTEKAGTTARVRPRDTVTVSGRASEASRITSLASELPDIRAERVAELRQRVESGQYNPPAADIAGAILRDEG